METHRQYQRNVSQQQEGVTAQGVEEAEVPGQADAPAEEMFAVHVTVTCSFPYSGSLSGSAPAGLWSSNEKEWECFSLQFFSFPVLSHFSKEHREA